MRKLEPPTPDVQEVVVALDRQPGGANGPVSCIGGRARDVPALDNLRASAAIRSCLVPFEPAAFDEIAFERNRPLLILGRELEAAHVSPHAIESSFALALRMQYVPHASCHHFA